MKSVKRILSVAVAVLLIAVMMIPAVSAVSYSITLNCSLPGYEYTIYKVADYDPVTGAFSTDYDALKGEVETSKESTAALLTACAGVTFTSSVDTFNTDGATAQTPATKTLNVGYGIFYIKMTTKSPNFKSLTQDAIVVFPNKDKTTSETLDLSGKISEGEPNVTKEFRVASGLTKDDQTRGTVDTETFKSKTITYVLTADVPASTVDTYIITDKMDAGLKAVDATNIKSVTLNGTTALDYEFVTNGINVAQEDTVNKQYGTTGNTFGIKIAASELAKPAFYTEGNKVVVEFETELDYTTAPVGTAINNRDDLIYGNATALNVRPGNPVTVKTYEVVAKKVDATTKAPLAGATFGLYEDEQCSSDKLIATAESNGSTGIANFAVKLPAGTYYIKETAAPTGYNLNSKIEPVTLGDTNASATVTIEDTKAKLPSTGGNGTLIFTIIGGSLVLLAAALFIIVMKKRSSAK